MDPSLNWTEHFSWEFVLPPSRPSFEQLQFFRKHLSGLDRLGPVLVLGSTPEYRDLLALLHFQSVFVVDKSASFHGRVSRARSTTSPETIIFEDWRSFLPKWPDRFSVVLSDLTSGNIPYDERNDFYQSIADALMSGGVFFDKVLTHARPLRLLRDLYEVYSRMPLNVATLNQFNCEVLFTSELLNGGILDTTAAYTALNDYGQEPQWLQYADKNRAITPVGCIWYYGRSYPHLEDLYGPALRCVASQEEPQCSAYGGYGFWTVMGRTR